MAMSSALFSGVAGLQVHQTMLDVVGNNLANANTTAYKTQRVDFQDLVYQTLAQSTGTNPKQIGLGSMVGSIDANFATGPLQTTGRDLDLAIQGQGFFVVNNGVQDFYTRAGAFDLDADGFIIDASTGYRLQRFGAIGEGTATTPAFQTPGDPDIQIPFGTGLPGAPTSEVVLQGNLSTTLAVGDTYTSAIQVYDTQGTQRLLTLTYTKTGSNTFDLNATVSGGTVTGVPVTGISFNADGTLASPATATIGMSFAPDLPATQNVALNFGTVGQADGVSQFGGDSTVAAVDQDGSAGGSLVNFAINQAGIIKGVFSNGRVLDIAQIGLAIFDNPGGLNRAGENLYTQSANSGEAFVEGALVGARGSMQPSALEGSNVDVASEFTKLIIAQRGFQINARAVTASNEVLQELSNIIR